jgi:hypothetical protein
MTKLSDLPDLPTIHDELCQVVEQIEQSLYKGHFNHAILLSNRCTELRKQRSMVKMLQAKHATQFFNEWDEELVSIENLQWIDRQTDGAADKITLRREDRASVVDEAIKSK